MSRGTIAVEDFGDCGNPDCDYPLPWDMSAIAFNDTNVFCSPECARRFLNTTSATIETATLHDPQGHADKPDSVDPGAVDISREVYGFVDAQTAIEEFEEMMNGPFTVEVKYE